MTYRLLILFCILCEQGFSQTDTSIPSIFDGHLSISNIDSLACSSQLKEEIVLTELSLPVVFYRSVWLSFDGQSWTGKQFESRIGYKKVDAKVYKPSTSFDTLIARLRLNNIYKLVDQDQLQLSGYVADGVEYTLTYKRAGRCRSYRFRNPEIFKHLNPEVKALDNYINIVRLLLPDP